VAALSANANAELYLDIGYWMLAYGDSASKVATAMTEIGGSGRVKGVTINTSNYRSNDECATYCTNFQTAMGSSDMTCIVDTSRNYNGSPTSDWCNVASAGIGKPPSSETGVSNLDYFMWIKPPGESDGECSGGPSAGSFFLDGFKLLWDQGYFVSEGGMPKIGDSSTTTQPSTTSAPSSGDSSSTQDTSSQASSTPTTAPTGGSSSWSQDDTVGTVAPADTTSTDAPTSTPSATTATPATTAPASETSTPYTTAPAVTDTASPATTSPSTTQPNGKTGTTTDGSSTTQARSACKAKKRLRSLRSM
jgi:cellulase/cellobiase CelA1